MRRSLRTKIRERANYACEYCGWPDWFTQVKFSLDHVVPLVLNGSDEIENRAYSCPGCNGYKHDDIEARDPASGELARFYNPRTDDWNAHFAWSFDGIQIVGISPTGRTTVMRLCLNRPEVLLMRQILPEIPRP